MQKKYLIIILLVVISILFFNGLLKDKHYLSSDNTIGIYMNDETTSEMPSKDNSSFVKAICDSDVDYYWDNDKWGLFINNIAKKVKCNLYFQDKLELELADDFPSEYTKGDNYPIVFTYDTGNLSGSVLCESDLDGKIANLNELTTTGNHNITCTLTNANNRSISISKEIKVTYDEYKITNLIANGSFESDLDSWSTDMSAFKAEIVTDAYHGNKAVKLITDNNINYGKASSMVYQTLKIGNPILNHKYYAFSYYKSSKDYYAQDKRFEWFLSGTYEHCSMKFGYKEQATEDWLRISNTQSVKPECDNMEGWHIRNFIRQSNHDVIIDSMVLIDLTNDFGEGNEPTLDWLDKHISYFDDTISIYK